MLKLSANRLEVIRTIHTAVEPHLGQMSDGSPAIHLDQFNFPSNSDVRGCLVSVSGDYLTRRSRTDLTYTKTISGFWQMIVIQYYGDPTQAAKHTDDFYGIKLAVQKHFETVTWQPSTPLRGTFPRATVLIGFESAIATC